MTQADHVIQMSLQVWIRSLIYVPSLIFEMSGLLASGSVPSWISKLEFSLRGDFGLFIGCTVWPTDCSLPVPSCERVHAHLVCSSSWQDACRQDIRTKSTFMQTANQSADGFLKPDWFKLCEDYVKNYNRWDRTKLSPTWCHCGPYANPNLTVVLSKILTGYHRNKSALCSDRNTFSGRDPCLTATTWCIPIDFVKCYGF